jgi:hypothetical protein
MCATRSPHPPLVLPHWKTKHTTHTHRYTPRLVVAYHTTRQQQQHQQPPPLEPRSQLLLLEAAARVAAHCPDTEAITRVERLCAPMWAGVAAAVGDACAPPVGGGGGGGRGGEGQGGDLVAGELRALATVVQAAGATGSGVGALAACFLARFVV